MKSNQFIGLVFVFTLLLLSGCGKRNQMNWAYYDETKCADRWEKNINNEALKNNITEYFDGKGVRIYDLEIYSDRTAENCPDCSCKTGRRIKVKVKGKDLKDIKAEGFYE